MPVAFALLTVILAVPGSAAQEVPRKPLFCTVDLNLGELQEVELSGGTRAKVKLLAVEETRDGLRSAVRQARVKVEVNGKAVSLVSATYHLPVTVAGVQIDCPVTRGYYLNRDPWEDSWGLDKAARLRLWPAGSPWTVPGTLVYPAKQRWFASATQMANEPAFVDGGEAPAKRKIYYHSGLDVGGCEGLVEVVAASEGLVVSAGGKALPEYPDLPYYVRGGYDYVYILDAQGWFYRYAHLKSIDPAVRPGQRVKMGLVNVSRPPTQEYPMHRITRRKFLQQAAAAGSVFPLVTVAGTKSSGRVLGANDAIRVGVAGIHGQGNAHIDQYLGLKGAQVTYLIDPDRSLFESRSRKVRDKGGNAPRCVQDIRKALEDKNLDVISVAAPNHWHSLITIWACQAGKDVYVEKPLSHNVSEGRRCVEAARKYGRLVQHGTQQRSSPGRANEIAAVQSGKYGKLLVSKGYCCKPRWSIGHKPIAKPPAALDFNLWLGPAPEQPYHGNLVHYNWHWFWDFGNGDIGNQGIHEVDVARWAIQGAQLPAQVWSLGGRFAEGDQGQTPNMQMAVFEYGDVLLVFEVRGLVDKPKQKDFPFKFKVLNEYFTTEGRIENGRFYPKNTGKPEPLARFDVKVTPGGSWGSFLQAVRSRKVEDLNAPVEHGHYSSALCHLANISYRLGEQVPFNGNTKTLGDNRAVVETFLNLQHNLRGAGVRLEETTYRLGRTLAVDAKGERCVGAGAAEANAFLTRSYRKPFVVPQSV